MKRLLPLIKNTENLLNCIVLMTYGRMLTTAPLEKNNHFDFVANFAADDI